MQNLATQFFSAAFAFSRILWTNREDRRIQRAKQVKNRSGITSTEVLIVVESGGGGGENQILAILRNRRRVFL
jgi:hypothetical protein